MAKDKIPLNLGEIIASWQIPEFIKHDRSRNWYIGAIAVGILFMVYSILTLNFLFAVITILGSAIIILYKDKDPEKINVAIAEEGVLIGNKFYEYEEIKNFCFVYKPQYDIKNLYFVLKNPVKQRLSIPLEDVNPLPIRKFLLKYLEEDLDRENEPVSEQLSKWLKL